MKEIPLTLRSYDPVTSMVTWRSTPFVGADYGFEIPRGWSVEHGVASTDIMALMPLETDVDPFRENINIVLDNTVTHSLDEYYEIQLKSLKVDLVRFQFVSTQYREVDGLPAKFIEFTHHTNEHVVTFQWYVLFGEGAYVITCTTKPGREAEFGPVFEKIVRTFVIDQQP